MFHKSVGDGWKFKLYSETDDADVSVIQSEISSFQVWFMITALSVERW